MQLFLPRLASEVEPCLHATAGAGNAAARHGDNLIENSAYFVAE